MERANMSARQIALVLQDLHLLTLIAETRSFTRAARQLGVSKSSVSMRIKDLERSAGVPLVRRTTRSITLTPAGIQLAEHTRASFAHIEQGFAAVKDLAGTPRGVVRITAPVALGRQHISPSVATLLRRYPEIRLELDLSDRFINLAQEGFDLAIRHSSAVPETYIASVLCESRSLLMASPDYLRRRGVPRQPADLARHDCLLYLREGSATPSWSFERSAGRRRVERVSVPVGGPFKANNSEVLREALLGGLGIGLLPDFSVLGRPRSESMVQVLSDWKAVGFFGERLYAIRPWAPRTPRAVECVIDHLRATCADRLGAAALQFKAAGLMAER
jgi:DNA-binding transcriptional LysR family regulator